MRWSWRAGNAGKIKKKKKERKKERNQDPPQNKLIQCQAVRKTAEEDLTESADSHYKSLFLYNGGFTD